MSPKLELMLLVKLDAKLNPPDFMCSSLRDIGMCHVFCCSDTSFIDWATFEIFVNCCCSFCSCHAAFNLDFTAAVAAAGED